MNKNNKSVIQQWSMPAKELPIEYPKLMAKINGWKADDGRLFIYTKKLQVALSNAIISGKLIVRDNFTGLYLEPGLDAYKYGIIDFQDFCDWANKAGLFGVPDNALKLAHAFEMPTETYLSESQQAFSLTLEATTSPAPEPQAAPVVAVGASDDSSLATVSVWRLIKTPKRLPGYRWPLYQFLEAALTAGQPCPKAQHVLDAWKLTPPTRLEVIELPTRDELEYELGTGKKKSATVKQIQAAIEGLLSK